MFAWDACRDIADDLLRARQPETLQYGPTRGYGPLIETLVPRLRGRGHRLHADEILLTTGSQQGVDLVTRLFVDPGDVVLVELPTFTGAIAAFRTPARRLVGVRQDADGLDLEHLDEVLARAARGRARASSSCTSSRTSRIRPAACCRRPGGGRCSSGACASRS